MLKVAPELLRLGLSTAVLVARGIDGSRTPPELAAYRRNVGRQLAAFWKNRKLSAHPALQEYEQLHRRFGVMDEPAAPVKILRYVRRHQDFTEAGALVDCYNLVSARTLLSLGAHDLAKLKTPITLRFVQPDDVFIPLGESTPRDCRGEYAYVDPDGQIICRMEVLQCEATKVNAASRDVVVFFQGNREIPGKDLLAGVWLLAELLERFCGGTAELIGYLEATGGTET
jgi:DNA/RNA-binding domain of Phe-tRNA-synthetase-like protein